MEERHPQTTKFILDLDNARCQHARAVQEWVEVQKAHGLEFVLTFLPAYSPNLNLIERLWKFLFKRALQECTQVTKRCRLEWRGHWIPWKTIGRI